MPHSLYKEFFSTNDLFSTLPSVVFNVLQDYEDIFLEERRYHQGCHLREELNIKLTLFSVLHFQTELHTTPTQRKQKKFSNK